MDQRREQGHSYLLKPWLVMIAAEKKNMPKEKQFLPGSSEALTERDAGMWITFP